MRLGRRTLGQLSRVSFLGLALSVGSAGVVLGDASTAEAQFNPSGRTRPKPGGTKPGGTRTKPRKPRKPKRPSRTALIKRYTKIVMQQPGALFPQQRLAQLYRERDGNLDKLIAKFERGAKKKGATGWRARVALAGFYKQDGRVPQAIETYKKAIEERPKATPARLALANLLADQSRNGEAFEQFEKALPHVKINTEKEQILRRLMGLALDLERWKDAKKFHSRLVKRAKGSFFTRAELGRELMNRGKYERAVAEYRTVVKAARGDNRVLAPALRDLGKALAKAEKRKEALSTLKKALAIAGRESGVRREIYDIIAEVYRAEEKLRELIALLEKEGASDFQRLKLLASLYEETGRVQKALKTYKRALAKKNRDIDTRLKVVQLLQIQGELDEAIKQYEQLIRAAPRNPDYVFQLAEALIQRGDRPGALEQLKKLEARSGRDEEVLAALVDFYERVEEKDRAMKVLQRLARSPRDPRHLVDLGDRYYQEGDKEKAVRTWKRIPQLVPGKARGRHMLGEVYLEHDMPDEALKELREAMKLAPKVLKYKKAYALALERTGASAGGQAAKRAQYEQALRIWEKLLAEAGDNKHLARESRQHIVTLWGLAGLLEKKVSPLDRRLQSTPPDLEAGRLLGEIHIRRRRYGDAERVLTIVTKHAKGDAPSFRQLERSLVMQRKMREAIKVLQKMVKIEPKRAREYYQRMAQYAAELYEDDEAIRYAAKAVELSPDDAEGHRKLGEMYRRRQDLDKAILQFRKAISKNDRLFAVYFQLAELLKTKGKEDEADRLLRRVIRASPDEDLVSQAAKSSMQLNHARGTLESLERELLPVALGNPQKPIYRRLLVDIYGMLALPLIPQSRSSDPKQAAKAKKDLRRIGERAVKPLLDALGDAQGSQQRTAINLLGHIKNKSAGPALVAYATSPAEPSLRVRAMIAAGNLEDPGLLPKLEGLIMTDGRVRSDESDPVFIAAAWSVTRLQTPQAKKLLVALLDSEAPSARALGAVGLGLNKDVSSRKRLAEVARSLEAGPLPRAAAAFALGELKAQSEADTLARMTEATDVTVRGTALVALGRLQHADAEAVIAEALVSSDQALRRFAEAAALVFATGKLERAQAFVPRAGRIDVRALLERLRPMGYTPHHRVDALVKLAPELARVSAAASQSSPERAQVIAEALLARGGEPAFGALTEELAKLPENEQKRAAAAVEQIAAAVVPPFVALTRHPDAAVRIRAVQLLSTRKEDAAQQAVLAALESKEPRVQAAALNALVERPRPGATAAVLKLLKTAKGSDDSSWPLRVRAAEALGKLATSAADRGQAQKELGAIAKRDAIALVREAALKALAALDKQSARSALEYAAKQDKEPRVRKTAQELLR